MVKLGIAIGAMREGAVHSSVRKARAAGASDAEMHHVLAPAATTIGFPATVAAFTWVREQAWRATNVEGGDPGALCPGRGRGPAREPTSAIEAS